MGSFEKDYDWLKGMSTNQVKRLTEQLKEEKKIKDEQKQAEENLSKVIRGEVKRTLKGGKRYGKKK